MAEKNRVELTVFGDPIKGAQEGNTESVIAVASKVTTLAKQFAPVDEGRLRGSIMWRMSAGPLTGEGGFGDGDRASAEGPRLNERPRGSRERSAGLVGTGVLYGVYQEFGTRKMAPSPFLRPAILFLEGRTVQEIRGILRDSLQKWVNRGRKRVRF